MPTKKTLNPVFVRAFGIALLAPILTSMGIEAKDIDTWGDFLSVVVNLVMNPFLLASTAMGVWIFLIDKPTSKEKEEKKEEESEE